MSMILLTNLALWVFGFIAGVLVGRKEVETVEKSLEEALTLYLANVDDLKAKAKKKKRTTTKKTTKKNV